MYFLLRNKEPQYGTQAFFDPHAYLHKAKEKYGVLYTFILIIDYVISGVNSSVLGSIRKIIAWEQMAQSI